MSNLLQIPPPLELAIGQLPPIEQSHAMVSMRVLAAHLKARCVVVDKEIGDITLKPCEGDDRSLCVVSAYGEAHLDRPMRLAPLSEALSMLIDGILSRTTGLTSNTAENTGPNTGHAAALRPSDQASLLEILLRRDLAGPLEIQFASGCSMLIDRRYSIAHLSAPVSEMLPTLADESIVSVATIHVDEFSRRTAKGNQPPLHPIGVEQLCWALPIAGEDIPELDRWHQNSHAHLSLDTWPNLSAQPDADKWLDVLSRLHRHSMRIDQLRDAAVSAGIPVKRARNGIALLLSYQHARIAVYSTPSEPSIMPMSNVNRRPSSSSLGLLGRLRSRLRALAA